MAFSTRKILFALLLLLAIVGSISALTKLAPALKSPANSAAVKSAVTRSALQLVKHEDGELILEWKCPDIHLAYDPVSHHISGIDMPGATSCFKTGVPALPQLSQLLDCLPGSVTAQIVDMDAETRPLGDMMAMPDDQMIDPPVDSGRVSFGALDDAGAPLSFRERSARTPLLSGMWPPQIVTVQEVGVFRGHRLMSVIVHPVQVDAQRGVAHIIKRIKVRVTMPRSSTAASSRVADHPEETDLVRKMLGPLASTAQPSRMPEAIEGRGAAGHDRLDDFDPLHPRWKIIVKQNGVVRITADVLRYAGCPYDQITAQDTHIKNRGHEIPIYFSGEGDNRFDNGDYIDFYGEPNQKTYQALAPSFHNDPWSDENVYWLSWGDGQPGMRLSDEDAEWHLDWSPQQVHPVTILRNSIHVESDEKYERLSESTSELARSFITDGPLGPVEDHWYWGSAIDGLTSRDFTVDIPFPARAGSGPEALYPITVRAALMGYTYGGATDLGNHRAIVYVNGQTAPGLQVGKTSLNDNNVAWLNQTPRILQTVDSASVGITSSSLFDGGNTFTVSLPGDGLAGDKDKVLVNWFEVEYQRAPLANFNGWIIFPFDTTRGDTFSYEIRGFRTRNISVWKLGRARLTNVSVRRVSPADEGSSWAARIQLISDGAYQILMFDDRYPQPPAAVVPETSDRDLRTLNGSKYLLIVHDSFTAGDALPWLQRLDSLRKVTFNGSADTIRVSQIYEQFNDGIVNPEAIRTFLKYAYEHWAVRPTHVCIVGDGVQEREYEVSKPGDLISSLYTLTDEYGATAADFLFGCVSGPPWDILPDIAVGRISCRSESEFETYVRKLISYDDPLQSAYNSLFHCTSLFVADHGSPGEFFDRDFSEVSVALLPDAMNVTRVYIDSIQAGQGPNLLRNQFRNGAVLMDYNGHGAGGQWSDPSLINVNSVRQLNNRSALPFITNFTCFVGAFDAIEQNGVLGEAFLFSQNGRLDPVGGIGVYGSAGPAFAYAGNSMQQYLYNILGTAQGLTLGEIVQLNKTGFWGAWGSSYLQSSNYYAMMVGMNLLGDPGVRLALPKQAWSDIHGDISLVHIGDTVRVSGTLPWDPAGVPTDLYLLPYNGPGVAYYPVQFGDSAVTFTSANSHIAAFNPDFVFPQQVTTRTFSNFPVPITTLLRTQQGYIIAYAVKQGNGGSPPQDAIGTIPLFLADSLNGVHVFSVSVLPLNGTSNGYLPEDTLFQLQVNLMSATGVERVRAQGIFQPAQGPVTLDTTDMTQIQAGLWRTHDLGPYSVYGGTYRVRFTVQPPGGADPITTTDYDLPVEGRNDFGIDTSIIKARPIAGTQPVFYCPITSAPSTGNVRDLPDVPVRLTAVHDSTYRDTTGHSVRVVLDSVAHTIHITNLAELSHLSDVRIPLDLWPQSYRVSVMVDPDNVIPEYNESNNATAQTIVMPNLYPATNALGTYMPRTSQQNAYHRFWQPGIADTILLQVSPGSLPVDSTTLIYLSPDTINTASMAILGATGITRPYATRPVHSFRVVMTDSVETLSPSGVAHVVMNFLPQDSVSTRFEANPHVLIDSLRRGATDLAVFVQRTEGPTWQMLSERSLTFNVLQGRIDTLFYHRAPQPDSIIRIDTTFKLQGRIAGAAQSLGRFAVFRVHNTQGPVIEIAVDGMHFTPHSILPRHPQMFVNFTSPCGIDRSLGKYYIILDNDSIPAGQISWSDSLSSGGPMSALIRPDLEPGQHVLRVKGTDNTGISDSISVQFEVSGVFGIEWAINYPNPFQKTTTIAYLLTDVADNFVECKVFTVSGRLIRTVREVERAVANYREITWDGRDERGNEVANGVYFARLRAKQGKQQVEKIVKLAKVR